MVKMYAPKENKMKKITFAIAGMGNRGTAYASKLIKFPEEMEIVALADTRRVRIDNAQEHLHLPENMLFDSVESLLEQPRLSDVLIIATQDSQHKAHALAALEKGYHLILEKPVSNDPRDCKEIAEAAGIHNRHVLVCHVLRYTPFYSEVKRLLDSGLIGKIQSIQADEQVGFYHYAHSYVRGNWHNRAASSPMILAKCCHDMDLMIWLTGKGCKKVSSFGSLDYFKGENCPEGAADRCADCKLDCVYNAQKFYLSRMPGWPTNILHPQPTEERVLKVLDETDYGKCVFKMDNDVVDHQIVNLLLEDGITVNFQMVGFSNRQTRWIRVMGTKGEIWGDFHSRDLHWQLFGEKEPHKVDVDALFTDFTGHGGGDEGLVRDAIRFFRGDENFDSSSITSISRSVESHFIAFAAEESRLKGGAVIELEDYIKSI
jgi:predicted dehydrogenase